jgi:hypothetical protein
MAKPIHAARDFEVFQIMMDVLYVRDEEICDGECLISTTGKQSGQPGLEQSPEVY